MTDQNQNDSLWTTPNLLTYGRVLAVFALVLVFAFSSNFSDASFSRFLGFLIFSIASATDFLDGYLARKWNQSSALGKMLDPIADKMLVATLFLVLCADGSINGVHLLAPSIILSREFLVSGVRELIGAQSGVLSVTQLAKWKTTAQMAALILLLVAPFIPALQIIALLLLWVSVVLTVITGADYFKKAWPHITKSGA